MTDIFTALSAPFPRDQVSWRAQKVNTEGDSALALAYIDARDVMHRLDEAVGPANWQDVYAETASGRVLCTLSLRIDGDWIAKTDGSGATDVEADKGGISDAFKRAAVKWGIGRYLYDLKSPWVPCESRESGGKKYWKAWKVDPWTRVRGETIAPAAPAPPAKQRLTPAEWRDGEMVRIDAMAKAGDVDGIANWPAAQARELAGLLNKAPDAHAMLMRFHAQTLAQSRVAQPA